MKKCEIARENVMTTVGRVTVAVYATDSTDKQTLSTVLYDGKSQLASGISAQMTYRPGSGLALEDAVKNIIARTSTKYEASQRPLCEHIDYAQAYAELKSANVLHQLCPVEWRAESTRRAALTYYERRSIPLIQLMLDRMGDPLALQEVQQEYLALARSRTDRGEANAIETANAHINAANLLYEASRHLLPQYDLPPIEIPLFIAGGVVPPEQAKALPRDDLVRLAELIRLDAAETPLAAGAALHNVAGGERVASMKTRNAYRQVILPKYAMDIVRVCREVLRKQGYGDSEINDAYVSHHPQDIYRPTDPRDISRYVKNKLELLGYNSTYWCGMEHVAQVEPDADERGNALTDVTAYLLRRSGCAYLCNCSSVPLPDGRSVMPHGLVDALMGHRLRGEDAWWAEWIRREDNWPIIAQVLEGIILDPDHSAHPAYAPAASNSSPQVCHAIQKYIVPADTPPGSTVTVTIRCHDHDRANVRLPGHIQVADRGRSSLSPQQSSMPDIQEIITEEYYNELKEDAQKIYRKAKKIR